MRPFCELQSCCLCIPPRGGTVIIALFDIAFTVCHFLLMLYNIRLPAAATVLPLEEITGTDWSLIAASYYVLMVLDVTLILFTIPVLIGTCLGKNWGIMAWLVHQVINTTLWLVIEMLVLADPAVRRGLYLKYPELKSIIIGVTIFWCLLKWYFLSVPYSYRTQKMRNGNNPVVVVQQVGVYVPLTA